MTNPFPHAFWMEALPHIVAAIGTPVFAETFVRALNSIAEFDLNCCFAYPANGRPTLLHDGLKNVSSPDIMKNYVNGTYMLDAVYDVCQQRLPSGLYRLTDIAPDNFLEGEYYNSPEFHPCISMETGSLADEIVFLVAGEQRYFAFSLLRQRSSEAFDKAEFQLLSEIAPLAVSLIGKHWNSLYERDSRLGVDAAADPDIGRSFNTFAADQLTPREQVIVSMILRGHSSLSASKALDISEGTVKNHRKHIYSKLGISSQSELFHMFILHLFGRYDVEHNVQPRSMG